MMRWLHVVLAPLAGLALYWSSPPRDLWWLAPLAFAVFAAVVWQRRMRAGFGYGLLFGTSYLLPLLGWLQDFLSVQFGPWPWLGLAVLQALFFGLAGAAMAGVSRLPLAVVWIAAVFVTTEELRSHIPFGGFPWGRLAFTQTTGPFMALAAIGGSAVVSFAVALAGTGLAQLGRYAVARRWQPREWAVPVGVVLVSTLAGLAVWPLVGTDPNAGSARVATVQGNAPNLGLGLLYAEDVLHENHMRAANELAGEVESGQEQRPDLVLLPEQVGNWGPARTDPELSALTDRLGVPVFAGGLEEGADGQLRNQVLRWEPEQGATGSYTKQHLVPFAETIPMRSVAQAVTPFVERFEQDMVPSDEPGVLEAGAARVGLGICYDVAYDDVFTGAAREGANVLAVPTNNAWYGHSEMSHQQLAMSQLRAVQHGRAVVVSATSGVSAIIHPDGTISQQTQQFTEGDLAEEVPLRSTTTLATQLGSAPMWTIGVLGTAAFVGLWLFRTRDTR